MVHGFSVTSASVFVLVVMAIAELCKLSLKHRNTLGVRRLSSRLMQAHSRLQTPRSFSLAPRIATSGQVERHSSFEWLCKHDRLRPKPIRFVRIDSEHAQSVVDFRRWTWPEVAILGADQKERSLWGRE